jgi:hypothetical protein
MEGTSAPRKRSRAGKLEGELTPAFAKVIETFNLPLKSELKTPPTAFGGSPHPLMHRWNWSDTSRNVEEFDGGDRAAKDRQRKIES